VLLKGIAQMQVCFVVMGFGKKTDYESGRTLDLNATYETIIQPAVTSKGLRCVRADEITQSGIIDVQMYEMLLRADLVIADISTGNVNAVYELGVRHALRPNSTIIMNEDQGKLHFDLNHVSTLRYAHFGEDIMGREVIRAKKALEDLIEAAMKGAVDSPVYTFLPKLVSPRMSDDQYEEMIDEAEAAQKKLSHHMHAGEKFMRQSDHVAAVAEFRAAREMKPEEPDILQKLALSTYKSKLPDEISALHAGLVVLEPLKPELSNDPETLGIAGAIYKRLWLFQNDRAALDLAIRLYGRGFEVRRDYYNGENFALCFEYRAQEHTEYTEKVYDFMSAQKIRRSIMKSLSAVEASPDFFDRPDKRWVYATLANCYFACEEPTTGMTYEQKFIGAATAQWELDTYYMGKEELMAIQPERLSALTRV
jgi:tetratricopeptide (TPR) repeat protein